MFYLLEFFTLLSICVVLGGVFIAIMKIRLFEYYNKDAMDEYWKAKKQISLGEKIDESSLRYNRVKYRGMIATSDKLEFLYDVEHPYYTYLRDKEKYGADIRSWSSECISFRNHESDPPQVGCFNYNSQNSSKNDEHTTPIEVPYIPLFTV